MGSSPASRPPGPHRPFIWGAGWIAALVTLAGCAATSRHVVLRDADDLRVLPGAVERFALPDSATLLETGGRVASPPFYGHLGADTLVLYRARPWSVEPSSYARSVRRVPGNGLAIAGYTTADGRHVAFDGFVRRVGDSLWFEPRISTRGMAAPDRRVPFRVSVTEVRALDAWMPDAGKTALILVLVGLTGAVVAVLAIASSFEQSAM